MLGYVTIERGELKVRELDVYQGYYCGICKSIGKRYGQIPRFSLSYDAAFLAIVLASLESGEKESLEPEHCIAHPLMKKPAIHGSAAIDYAADVMLILAYHKFDDDRRDEKKFSGYAGCAALSSAYRKLRKNYRQMCDGVHEALKRLGEAESRHSGSLDETAGAFADIMELIFTGYDVDPLNKRVLSELSRALGRWIYVIDALDDYEKDKSSNTYNPFIYRKNSIAGAGDILYNYLADAVNAVDLLDIRRNRGIIENIVLLGLRRRTDKVLEERNLSINEQSI